MSERMVALPERLVKEAEDLSAQKGMDTGKLIEQALAEGLRRVKEEHILELYRLRKVSLAKASEMLGVDIWTMIDKVKEADIHLDYGLEELREDMGL